MNNNQAVPIEGILCVLLFVLPVVLAIGALILWLAILLANMVLGRLPEIRDESGYDDSDDDRPRRSRWSAGAVPLPRFGKTMGIVFVKGIVGFVVQKSLEYGVGEALKDELPPLQFLIAFQAVAMPIGFLVNAGMLSAMIPTTFGRSCLVVLFEYLILIAIAIVGVAILIAGGAGAGVLNRFGN